MNEIKLREVIEESLRATSLGPWVAPNDYKVRAKLLAADIAAAQYVDAARVLAEIKQARKCRYCGEPASSPQCM